MLSTAVGVRNVKAVVELIGAVFLLTATVDGPQKSLTCTGFSLSVRSTSGLGTSKAAALTSGNTSVTFPRDLGSAALMSLPAGSVVDAQLVVWSSNIYEALQSQQQTQYRSRRLYTSLDSALGYRPKTSVLGVVLSHNGSRLSINATTDHIMLQIKALPDDSVRAQTGQKRRTSPRKMEKNAPTTMTLVCTPGATHALNRSCIPTLVPKAFGLFQSRKFVISPRHGLKNTSTEGRLSAPISSMCDTGIHALSVYLCMSGCAAVLLALIFAVSYRNWRIDPCRSAASENARPARSSCIYHRVVERRVYYDNGIRFTILGGLVIALVAVAHLVFACGHGALPLMAQRVIAIVAFGVILTVLLGGSVMLVIILPCVAGETFRFEANQRRRDIFPICAVFSLVVLLPGVVFASLLLMRGSIIPFGNGEYNTLDLTRSTASNSSRGNASLFTLSPDGASVICGQHQSSITVECPGTGSNITSGAFEVTASDTIDLCGYWDDQTAQWSGDGCEYAGVSGNGGILCKCDHLTDFSAGSGETYATLARIFAPDNFEQLFTVHWYVLLLIFFILSICSITAVYGHHYDNRVIRRSGLEAAMLASIIANKMLRRLRSTRHATGGQYSRHSAGILAGGDIGGGEEGEKSEKSDLKNMVPSRHPESLVVNLSAAALNDAKAPSSHDRTNHRRKLSDRTRNKSWYRDYRRASIHYNNDVRRTPIDSGHDNQTNRQQNKCARCLGKCCGKRFCTVLCHRMLHEHDVFELIFVNNRWYTRTDRIMVLFTRITLKFSVCAVFFLWSRNFGTFKDLYGQGTGNLDVGGKIVAVASSFTANKVFGTLFKGLFVFLAGKRRRQLYDHLRVVARGAEMAGLKTTEAHNQVMHDIHRLEAEAMVARHRGHYDAGHVWQPLLRCVCHPCTLSKTKNLRILSVVVWSLSVVLVGFLLFFLVGYGFALSDKERVQAWIQTAIISCATWLCFTAPLKILLKTAFQMFAPTLWPKLCCCSKHGGNHRGAGGAAAVTKSSETFSGIEMELSRMKAEMNNINQEISRDSKRKANAARSAKLTAHARSRPSRAEAKLHNKNVAAAARQQQKSSEHRRRSLDEMVEDIFIANHSMAYSPATSSGKKKRWRLHYETEEGSSHDVIVL